MIGRTADPNNAFSETEFPAKSEVSSQIDYGKIEKLVRKLESASVSVIGVTESSIRGTTQSIRRDSQHNHLG